MSSTSTPLIVRTFSRKESNVAEPIKGLKITLREILDEIAEDENIDSEEREKAVKEIRELEYNEWCLQQIKSGG